MGTVGGDDMLTSNNRRRARGGSRFFGDFLFLGDLDQPNILGTACFPVKVLLKSASLKYREHTLVPVVYLEMDQIIAVNKLTCAHNDIDKTHQSTYPETFAHVSPYFDNPLLSKEFIFR